MCYIHHVKSTMIPKLARSCCRPCDVSRWYRCTDVGGSTLINCIIFSPVLDLNRRLSELASVANTLGKSCRSQRSRNVFQGLPTFLLFSRQIKYGSNSISLPKGERDLDCSSENITCTYRSPNAYRQPQTHSYPGIEMIQAWEPKGVPKQHVASQKSTVEV